MKKTLMILLTAAMLLSMATGAIAETGADAVKVALLFPYTGSAASVAEDAQKGFEFAIDIINERGGVKALGGAKIEIVVGDTQSSEEAAASEAERLITKENVVAIAGCYQSAVSLSVQTICERYGVPFLITCSTGDMLTTGSHPFSYRIHEQNQDTGICQMTFINDINERFDGAIKTAALLYQNDDWGQSLSEQWYELLTDAGVDIVVDETFASDVVDLTTVVTKLIDKNPDVVLNACYFQSMVLLTNTMIGKGYATKAMICSSSGECDNDFIPTVGDNANGFYTVSGWGLDVLLAMPDKQWIGEGYSERYDGEYYTAESAAGWASAMMIYEGLEAAGSTDRAAVNAAIRASVIPLDSWWNIYPYVIEFDQVTGENINAIPVMGQFQNRAIKLIYPEPVIAEGVEMVFPASQLSPLKH